jgi:hypothetical protein
MEKNNITQKAKENLERIMLFMNYDSKKTLSENLKPLHNTQNNNILLEDKTGKLLSQYRLSLKDNPYATALFSFQVPSGSSVVEKNGLIIITGKNGDKWSYTCGTKLFKYTGILTGSGAATYTSDFLSSELETNYCKKTEKDKKSGNWCPETEPCNGKNLQYKWENGDLYKGDWVNGSMDGQGYYKWSNGDSYLGSWKNRKMDGSGVYIYLANGSDYTGQFKNDKFNGYGTYTSAEGNLYQGTWKDDELILGNGKYSIETLNKWSKAGSNKKNDTKISGGGKGDENIKTTKNDNTKVSKLKDCPTGPYSLYCKGDNVKKMQECLKKEGLYNYKIDGEFLKRTLEGVKKKLNKDTFTDEDIKTVCNTKKEEDKIDFNDPFFTNKTNKDNTSNDDDKSYNVEY